MSKGKPELPEQRDYKYAFDTALEIAFEELSGLNDIKQQCLRSGAGYIIKDNKETITLKFLGNSYSITRPDIGISIACESKPPSVVDKLLILHYFLKAKGNEVTGENISFRELPEGLSYYPSFYKRAIKPLVKHFGDNPHKLISAASAYDAREKDYGDASITINAFKRVPVTFVLWRGDSEFEAEGSILFDSSIPYYLPTEDITILSQVMAYRLIASSKD